MCTLNMFVWKESDEGGEKGKREGGGERERERERERARKCVCVCEKVCVHALPSMSYMLIGRESSCINLLINRIIRILKII